MASGLQFEDLMSMAEDNAIKGEKKIKTCTAPQFNLSAPKVKKQTASEKQLSEGVRKFLQRKEEEERQKAEQERMKKERLLQLRSQDKKAGRRVNSMLRMTKSANKACMDDAKDCFSNSLAAEDDFQPDEDDYGYVSQYSQEMHKKLLDKYKQTPVSKTPVTNKILTPAAVPHALKQSKQKKGNEDYDVTEPAESNHHYKEPEESNAKKKKGPPPDIMNFQDLLKLANEKSQQPVAIKPKVLSSKEKEVFEFGRPMTAKEKAAYLKEKALRERVHALHEMSGAERNGADPKAVPSVAKFKIPNLKKKDSPSAPLDSSSSSSSSHKNSNGDISSSKRSKSTQESSRGSLQNIPPSSMQRPSSAASKSLPLSKPTSSGGDAVRRTPPHKPSSAQEKSASAKRLEASMDSERKLPSKPSAKPVPQDKPRLGSSSGGVGSSNGARLEQPKPQSWKAKPSTSASLGKPPTKDLNRQRARSPEPSRLPARPPPSKAPVDRRPPPPRPKMPPPRHRPPQKRRIIESDEEYDSEMDDFIDDGDGEQVDISSLIRDIYGYDRNKYVGIDDDDIEEASFEQMRREEIRSARIGLQEDLEDMRKEEEEKRRKMLMRKKMRR